MKRNRRRQSAEDFLCIAAGSFIIVWLIVRTLYDILAR